MTTINPANVINKTMTRLKGLGSLQMGTPGDVTLLDVVDGPVEFVDTRDNKRQGKVQLKVAGVVNGDVGFGRPYNAPFSVR